MNTAVQSCPEPVALPVIFVPGIMGSRLRQSASKRVVWDPQGIRRPLGMAMQGAQSKRRNLVGPPGRGFNPNFLEVHPGEVDGTLTQERIDRGWGGLMWSFYESFMAWLEHTAETPAAAPVPNGCQALKYEAWAHPYNWTDTNLNSGQKLAATVDAAIAGTTAKYAGTDVRVLKPVIVTHSMGGLVARAYVKLHGGEGKVQGVIHGAMPTDGAPATYKRILAGFENGAGALGFIERHVLGANGREVTATAANCPGPLELLPNMRHKSVDGSTAWLKHYGRGGNLMLSKPSGNPYQEIYLNRTDWWRLVYAQYLDPAGDPNGSIAFNRYMLQLNKAFSLHSRYGASGFHSNTRMYYSNDSGIEAWDHIAWRQTAAHDTGPPNKPFQNDNRGQMEWGEWYTPPMMIPGGMPMPQFLADTRFELQDADAPGDGTVHAGSGRHVSGPMSVPTRRGFLHGEAMDPREARQLIAEWLFAMVEEQL